MSYSPKHPSGGSHAKSAPVSAKQKKTNRILIIILLVVLALIIAGALILAFVPGAESGIASIFTGNSGYVPETQDGTTIISQYYENGVLPTSGDRHDVSVINGGGASASELEGVWDLDGNTIYEFDGRGRGIMLTAVDNYTFVYSAQNGELIVDFDIDDAMDAKYSYSISGNTLTMSRGGQTYIFTKDES